MSKGTRGGIGHAGDGRHRGGREEGTGGLDGSPTRVGYRNPPRHTRFKPGQSGNPSGRPKGSGQSGRKAAPGLGDLLIEASRRMTEIERDGVRVSVSRSEAMADDLTRRAAAGDLKAQRLLLPMLKAAEREDEAKTKEDLLMILDYKAEAAEEVARCRREKRKDPELAVDPDDILIDLKDGSVSIATPETEKDHRVFAMIKRFRQDTLCRLWDAQVELAGKPNDADVSETIRMQEQTLPLIERRLAKLRSEAKLEED